VCHCSLHFGIKLWQLKHGFSKDIYDQDDQGTLATIVDRKR
jgi:hypothetical protein